MNNVLDIKTRSEFRTWLAINSTKENECFLVLKRGKPEEGILSYLDSVEEALCFGWIDSTLKKIDGTLYQRFSPRRKNSPFSELNKERARRLIKLGLMTEKGLEVLPDLEEKYVLDSELVEVLKREEIYDTFLSFPSLYQRVRAYNVTFYIARDKKAYQKALDNLIKNTKQGKMYGMWNDYGRLLDY